MGDAVKFRQALATMGDEQSFVKFNVGAQMASMLRFRDVENDCRVQLPVPRSAFKNLANARACRKCGNKTEALFKCSGCGSVWYCSTQCQKSHWKEGHKHVCFHSLELGCSPSTVKA